MENYEKIKRIGRGAYGSVSLCARKSDGHKVVVKKISLGDSYDGNQAKTLSEAKILQLFNFPFIIGYYDYFIDVDGYYLYIVMEYAEGGTLADLIAQQNGRSLDEAKIVNYFCQIVMGLHQCHSKQVLHRDLKPQNILLNKARTVCKLSDFGVSKILSDAKRTAVTFLGTLEYMSPEVIQNRPYSSKTDVWGLGCILYELITTKKAFQAENLVELSQKVVCGNVGPIPDCYSEELRKLIFKLLDRDPSKRPTLAEVMSTPLMIGPMINIMLDMGSLAYYRPRVLGIHESQKLRSSVDSKKRQRVGFARSQPGKIE